MLQPTEQPLTLLSDLEPLVYTPGWYIAMRVFTGPTQFKYYPPMPLNSFLAEKQAKAVFKGEVLPCLLSVLSLLGTSDAP